MSLFLTDIDATCASLGYFDGKKYFIERDTLQALKHLIWILRRDNETHEYRRHIGCAKVLETDLLPMAIDCEDSDLFDVLLRLLVNLTSPTLLLYKEDLPKDTPGRRNFLELVEILQGYKEAFVHQSIWSVFGKSLQKMLEIHWNERSETQGLHIERLLVLIRNVLQVPENSNTEQRADNDASLHDQVLWSLQQAGVLDLVLYVIGSEDENQYHLHGLEILFLIYREQTPDCLADAFLHRSVFEKQRDEQELILQRKRERAKQLITSTRHSRFGGTYVLKNMKSISDNDIICHQSLKKAISIDFDSEKVKQKKLKIIQEQETTKRRSAFSVRLFLREFSIEILRSAYNNFVRQVKRTLERNANSSGHDDSYLLWAITFFMEFNRLSDFQLDLVSESLSVSCFHFVLTRAEHHLDMIGSDKAHSVQWSRRLHIVVKVYRELLLSIQMLHRIEDEKAQELFKKLQNNIFYVLEYRETLLHILINYNERYNTKAFLCDVIETAHIFLKMMEVFCQGGIVVQQKRKIVKKKKNKNSKKDTSQKTLTENGCQTMNENIEDSWLRIAPQLSVVLSNELDLPETEIPMPFDIMLEISIDDQKSDCMIRIHQFLKEEKFEYAVSLFRSAREVWLEDDCFGTTNSVPEEELMLLKEIFFSKLKFKQQSFPVEKPADEEDIPLIDGNCGDDYNDYDNENENENYEDEEEENERETFTETNLKFEDFANRLINPRIVHGCTVVLTDWEHITAKTLNSTLKILHRIAFGCKMPTMLYQASLFRVFQDVLNRQREKQFEELRKFSVFIIRKFVETASKNSKVYAELLFSKSLKEAYSIENGYDTTMDLGAKSTLWTEDEEEDLKRLFYQNQENPETDKDVIDWLIDNLVDQTKTRRQVMKKLRQLGLKFKKATKKSIANAISETEWQYEEDEQLQRLFDEFRLDKAPLKRITEVIGHNHKRNSIINRLIKLGLIADKSDIIRKRKPKEQYNNNDNDINENNNNETESSDSEESESESNENRVQSSSSPLINNRLYSSKKNNKIPIKAPRKVIPLDINKMKYVLLELNDTHPNSLKWLAESLDEACEDFEEDIGDDPDDGIPLVPLTMDQITSMNNDQFIELLKMIGFQKPQKEMETYWRIPVYWNIDDIKQRSKILRGNYEDGLASTEITSLSIQINDNNNPENINQINLMEKNNQRRRQQQIDNIIYNDSDNEYETSLMKNNKKKRIESVNTDDNHDDDDGYVRSMSNKMNGHDKVTMSDNINVENKRKKKNKKKNIFNEDEDDMDMEDVCMDDVKYLKDKDDGENDFDIIKMRKRLSKLIDNSDSDNDNNSSDKKNTLYNENSSKSKSFENINIKNTKEKNQLIDLSDAKHDKLNKSLFSTIISENVFEKNLDDDDIDTRIIELSHPSEISSFLQQQKENINKKRERSLSSDTSDSDTSISNKTNFFYKNKKKRVRQILSDDDDDDNVETGTIAAADDDLN